MEGFVARSDLLPRDRVKELSRKTNVRGLAHLALHMVTLTVTGVLVWQVGSTWWVGPAMVIHGIVLAFLFCFHHELIHRTVFTRPFINDGLSVFVGWLVFYPAFYFRLFHYAHHRHTQDPEHDPELVIAPPTTRLAYVWWGLSIAYMWRRFGTSFTHAFTGQAKQPFVLERYVSRCVAEARLMWVGYLLVIMVSVYFETWVALQYWLVPILLGQPFLRLYLMAEHVGCSSGNNMIANARTTISNPIVRTLAWNMPYHTEHHLFPSVPFHALPALHEDIKDQLKFVAPGYIAVHRQLWPST